MMIRCFGCMQPMNAEEKICPHCGYAPGTPAAEAIHMRPGTCLARRYTVGKVLGWGGFGVTYIGWDEILQQRVAIKEYLPSEFATRVPGSSKVVIFEGDRGEQYRSGMVKFVEEARHLAQFQNEPGIVKVFDSFEENDTAYIIMEYLEGETLSALLEREGTIPEDQAVAMLTPLMESLQVVHEKGILHRDIAPDNIFITKDGEVKLIDFGASRYATTSHSRSLTVIIKPGYSPEEQYRSRGDQGPHTDVYALASTLYKMITGVTPPDALERRAEYENHNKDILKEPHKIKKDISLARENAILNGMNVRIEDRTPDVKTFIKELNADPPARRIYGKIKKIDLYRLPLWLKVAVPSALALVLVFAGLLAGGVIRLGVQQKNFMIPDGVVMVPDVEGMVSADAIRKIEESGLLARTEGNIETAYVEAGVIVLQSPVTGSFLAKNGEVRLTVSSGGGIVSPVGGKAIVPYIIWDTEETAKEKLTTAGLGEPEIRYAYDDNVAEGQIISQEPAVGTELEEGSRITLTVSLGAAPFELPDVTGKSEEEAEKTLTELGLKVSKEYEQSSDAGEGSVLRQDLPAGSKVRRGDTVRLTVCSGKETVEVPDVAGMPQAEAEKLLKDNGFTVNALENFDETIPSGTVISQQPEAHSQQVKGSEITLYVSKGPKETEPNSTEAAVPTLPGQESAAATLPAAAETTRVPEGTVPATITPTTAAASATAVQTTAAPTTKAPTTAAPTTKATETTVPTAAPTTQTAELISFTVKTMPNKTEYIVGERFDYTGLTFECTYSDGTKTVISWEDDEVDIRFMDAHVGETDETFPDDPSSYAGPKKCMVYYRNKVIWFYLTYRDPNVTKIEIQTPPSRRTYVLNETLDTAGLTLKATYENGTTKTVSSGFSCTPTTLDKAGTITVTVYYASLSTAFTVTVTEPTTAVQTWTLVLRTSEGTLVNKSTGQAISGNTVSCTVEGSTTLNALPYTVQAPNGMRLVSWKRSDTNANVGLDTSLTAAAGATLELYTYMTNIQYTVNWNLTDNCSISVMFQDTSDGHWYSVPRGATLFRDTPVQITYTPASGYKLTGHGITSINMSDKMVWELADSSNTVGAGQIWATVEEEAVAKVGDSLTIGSYGGEAVEWRVLAVSGTKVLVISRYGLEPRWYHSANESVTWETSEIRSWLNGTFYNGTFTQAEKGRVQVTAVENKTWHSQQAPAGNNTNDRLFLLSYTEASTYFSSNADRVCYPTQYAKNKGALTDSNGACYWWLRSPGAAGVNAAENVYPSGLIEDVGGYVWVDAAAQITVRPAMWYDLGN